MLHRNYQLRVQLNQWLDSFLFAFALWVAHALRHALSASGLGFFSDPITDFYPDYLWLFLIIIPVAPLILESQGFYKRQLACPRGQMAWQLAKSCFFSAAGLILILYAAREGAARGVLVFFGILSFIFIYLKEELVRWSYHKEIGATKKRVILVGSKTDMERLRADLISSKNNFQICGELDLNEMSVDQLVQKLHTHSINCVIISARHAYFGHVEKTIQACELEGVEAWLSADFFNTRISRTSLDEFDGKPVLVFSSAPPLSWSALSKQVMDLAGALCLLIVTSPVLILVAIIIKLTSKGTILFRQQRASVNGKPFTMYKFRSMVTNAEQLKQELANLNEMSGPVFKITKDPRITGIGRWLRKFSLDEFPQIFNVLRGDMSLVGPRPLPVDEVNRFDDYAHRRRLSVKPGLTCLWQVSGRNNVTDFKEWVRLDLQYIDNWSLWLDFKILFMTIPVVLLGKGAK